MICKYKYFSFLQLKRTFLKRLMLVYHLYLLLNSGQRRQSQLLGQTIHSQVSFGYLKNHKSLASTQVPA